MNATKTINLVIFSCCFLFLLTSCKNRSLEVSSPSGKLEVQVIDSSHSLKLNILDVNGVVMNIDAGKFVFGVDTLHNNYVVSDVRHHSVNEEWHPVYGERSVVQNRYNEMTVSLSPKDRSQIILQLVCRVYDEGIAFRYLFDRSLAGDIALSKELTRFNFEEDYQAWITNEAQGRYRKDNISKIKEACERPLVIKREHSSYLAIGEAALVDYARMKLKHDPSSPMSLLTELDGKVDLNSAGFITPWRYVMVANTPGELLENNYFVQNLNDPNKLEDSSWIKPGKVIREVTLTTAGGMACIDFAARHNLQYVEFDAGWYGPESDDESDASTITVDPQRSSGPLELHHVIEYGNQKGIGVILYVNRKALEKQIDKLLPLYKSWGIKGLKYGFVNVGPQEWTVWLHDAVRKAADYQLMVDIHDEYRPTGYSRTYPNLMTQEGIRGDEETPSIEHSIITLFTRMIAGAGDNTNCYYAERVSENMGGKTGQMAKAIMLYSPWQFVYWYDRPIDSPHKKGGAGGNEAIIDESEDIGFYDALPTVWDETKVLEGEIGKYATVARRNGNIWFIGTLVANQKRKVDIPLTFLDKNGKYEAVVYYQQEEDMKDNKVRMENIRVNQQFILSKELLKDSGLAVIIRKI